jgi:hypothetical protein
LHDLLANHKDTQTSASRPEQQIIASGYHCHIDDLVVMAPFLPDIQTTEPVLTNQSLTAADRLLISVLNNN